MSYKEVGIVILMFISVLSAEGATPADALAGGLTFLREKAAADPDGWVAPPRRNRTAIGTRDVTVRYRKVMVERPVYEYEYETVRDYARAGGESGASERQLTAGQHQRIKSMRQTGTETIERLVRDPDGPIEVQEQAPVFGEGGPDEWHPRTLGYNALALYAMRRAGASPDDETVRRLAQNLSDFVEQFGVPEHTWSIAWMTAAFASLPDDAHRAIATRLAGLLIGGQKAEGPAAGLWGPVCVNYAFLPALVEAEHKSLQARQRAASRTGERRLSRAEDALSHVSERAAFLQPLGVMYDHVDRHTVKMVSATMSQDVLVTGLPEYIYNQTSADIEHTALALFALSRAAEAGCLPDTAPHPEFPGAKKLAPPRRAQDAMVLAVRALIQLQQADGSWHEGNLHQPVRAFDDLDILRGVPLPKTEFPPLPSAATRTSWLQGYASLCRAWQLAGADRTVQSRILSSETVLQRGFEAEFTGLKRGGQVSHENLLYTDMAWRRFGTAAETRRDLWEAVAERLAAEQGTDGAWGTTSNRDVYLPTSAQARKDVLGIPWIKDSRDVLERGRPHVPSALFDPQGYTVSYRYDGQLLDTSYAMIFLADGIRPPVALEWRLHAEGSGSGILPAALDSLGRAYGASFTYELAEVRLPNRAIQPPVLVATGRGDFDPDSATRESLKQYLGQGGLVVVEFAPDEPGLQFLHRMRSLLQELLPTASQADLGAREDVVGPLAGQLQLRGLTDQEDRPRAAFIALGANADARRGVFNPAQAGRILHEMLMRRTDLEK